MSVVYNLHERSLVGIIPCVGYADFLRYTLPSNSRQLDYIIVLTDSHDQDTPEICLPHPNVQCIRTDVWTIPHRGKPATFNKGRGLNVGLDHLWRDHNVRGWVCALDADIILPNDIKSNLESTDESCLYSCQRRFCLDQSQFNATDWGQFHLDPPPQYSPKTGMWGNPKIRTSNAAGLYGYMQMWSTVLNARFPTQFTAAHSYDVRFGMGWPDNRRKWLPQEVLHLGWPRTNWNGRVTEIWKEPAGAKKRSGRPDRLGGTGS